MGSLVFAWCLRGNEIDEWRGNEIDHVESTAHHPLSRYRTQVQEEEAQKQKMIDRRLQKILDAEDNYTALVVRAVSLFSLFGGFVLRLRRVSFRCYYYYKSIKFRSKFGTFFSQNVRLPPYYFSREFLRKIRVFFRALSFISVEELIPVLCVRFVGEDLSCRKLNPRILVEILVAYEGDLVARVKPWKILSVNPSSQLKLRNPFLTKEAHFSTEAKLETLEVWTDGVWDEIVAVMVAALDGRNGWDWDWLEGEMGDTFCFGLSEVWRMSFNGVERT